MEQNRMESTEHIEKVRQEIMRFRELLNVMHERLQHGEQAYTRLFSRFPPDEIAGMKEKDLQWRLAETMIADVSPLSKAVIQMRFDARELERAFEELYDVIVTVESSE
jgi:3-methyladenine DNA glycosylase Tag